MTEFKERVIVLDDQGRTVFLFDPKYALLDLGGQGNEGDLRLFDDQGHFTFHLDAGTRTLLIRDKDMLPALVFTAENSMLQVGTVSSPGNISVSNDSGLATIILDGHTGDIQLANADTAEELPCSDEHLPEPATVVAIRDDGGVGATDRPYDTRVAGVVSGAGGYRPGILLGRQPGARGVPVALNGRTGCLVDATEHPIRAGDLLTSSARPGHAMAALDRDRLAGCLVGKALAPLESGTGIVPVLVGLR